MSSKQKSLARTPQKRERKQKAYSHILVIYVNHYQKTIHEITLVDAVAEEAAYDYNFFRKSKLYKEGLNCMSMLFATMCMIMKM